MFVLSYNQTFPDFRQQSGAVRASILSLISDLCQVIHPPDIPGSVNDLEYDVDRFQAMVETTDHCYEKVDISLDTLAGVGGDLITGAGAVVAPKPVPVTPSKRKAASISRTMLKPQLRFKGGVDNYTAFRPLLTTKPHAMVPLEKGLVCSSSPKISPEMEAHLASMGVSSERTSQRESHPHPYAYELEHFQYLNRQVCPVRETLYAPLDQVPCDWIDTEEDLRKLAADLDAVSNNPNH
jgi:hypothetical protein